MLRVCLLLLVCAVACHAQQCGVPAIDPIDVRVVGGYEAKPHSWPWQVSLRLKLFNSDLHWCGGSLINDQWIVTAAHCVDGREDFTKWNIWLGAHDSKQRELDTIKTQPAAIFKHTGLNAHLTNDIALIKLPGKVTFSDEVSPVCLPSKTPTSGNGYVTGWGDTQLGGQTPIIDYPAKLQQVMTPVMDHKVCKQKMAPLQVDETMICAGFAAEEKGACTGDSGGPYVIKNSSGEWELAGIASFGRCGRIGSPTIYADAYYFINWIQNTMAANGN